MNKIIKKFTFATITAFLLTACGSSTDDTAITAQNGKALYENTNFAIQIPQEWEVVENKEFPSTVPKSLIVAFRNNIKNEIFTANLTITAVNTETGLSSIDFAKNTKTKTKNALIAFEDISEKDYLLPYKDKTIETKIYEFKGKQLASDPIVQFKQFYAVNNNIGYTITAAFLPIEDDFVVKNIDEMLNSFTLK